MLKADVLAHVRGDTSLDEDVRRDRLAVAEQLSEDAWSLNRASWAVVRRPGAEPAAYRLALRQAEDACRLIPRDGHFLTTLGASQYRLGRDREAVATLTEADRIWARSFGAQAQVLIFLSLAQYRMGQADLARSSLDRLHKIIEVSGRDPDTELPDLYDGVEELERELAFPPDPFAPARPGLPTGSARLPGPELERLWT
jgi:hypothetical protein